MLTNSTALPEAQERQQAEWWVVMLRKQHNTVSSTVTRWKTGWVVMLRQQHNTVSSTATGRKTGWVVVMLRKQHNTVSSTVTRWKTGWVVMLRHHNTVCRQHSNKMENRLSGDAKATAQHCQQHCHRKENGLSGDANKQHNTVNSTATGRKTGWVVMLTNSTTLSTAQPQEGKRAEWWC